MPLHLCLLELWGLVLRLSMLLPWLQLSLVLDEHLHLVDEVPGNPQDLLGIVMFSPLWGKYG
jgi:hypothetical protein